MSVRKIVTFRIRFESGAGGLEDVSQVAERLLGLSVEVADAYHAVRVDRSLPRNEDEFAEANRLRNPVRGVRVRVGRNLADLAHVTILIDVQRG